jgi:hypothetical protein
MGRFESLFVEQPKNVKIGEETKQPEKNSPSRLKKVVRAATFALFIGLGLGAKESKALEMPVSIPVKDKIEYLKRFAAYEDSIRTMYGDILARPASFEKSMYYEIPSSGIGKPILIEYQQKVWETSVGSLAISFPPEQFKEKLSEEQKNKPVFVMLTTSDLREDPKTHKKSPITSTYLDWQADGEVDAIIIDNNPIEKANKKKAEPQKKELNSQLMGVYLAQLEQANDNPVLYPSDLFAKLFEEFRGQEIIIFLAERSGQDVPKIIKVDLRVDKDVNPNNGLAEGASLASYEVIEKVYHQLLKQVQIALIYSPKTKAPKPKYI